LKRIKVSKDHLNPKFNEANRLPFDALSVPESSVDLTATSILIESPGVIEQRKDSTVAQTGISRPSTDSIKIP